MGIRSRVAAVGLLSIVCAASAQEDFDAVFAAADAHFARFENRLAAELYKRASALRPDDFHALEMAVRAHHDYALDLVADQDEKGARNTLNQAVVYAREMEVKFPSRAETYFYLAATNGSLARFEGGRAKVEIARNVERNCKRAIELNSSFALAHAVLGVFYREVAGLNVLQKTFAKLFFGGVPEGSNEDALRSLRRAVELDPQLVFARFELAVTYGAVGDAQAANENLQRVVQLRPQTSQDVRNQAIAGQMLRQSGE
jgi:tetratricopeptide (TPR) repeat protein